MSNKLKSTSNELIFSSFPDKLAILIAAFYIVFLFAIFNSDNDLSFIDFAIFQGVILIAACIPQFKKTTINKVHDEVLIVSRGILNKTIKKLSLSDVKSVEMSYGRGSGSASGGAVVITTDSERVSIAASDILSSSIAANKDAQTKIDAFIFSKN